MVSLPHVLTSVACPVEGCPERAHNLGRLRDKFMYRHWKSKIEILQEVLTPLPQCDQCRMHIPMARLGRNIHMDRFDRDIDICLQWRELEL